jgi:6-phosphogluconolactonase (cycloisomerase 2 family)
MMHFIACAALASCHSSAPDDGDGDRADTGPMSSHDASSARDDASESAASIDAAEGRDTAGNIDDDGTPAERSDPSRAASDAATFDASDAVSEIREPEVDAASTGDAGSTGDARSATDAGSTGDVCPANDAGSRSDALDERNPNEPTELAFVLTYLGGIWGFTVNPATGAPTMVPGSPFDRGVELYAMAVLPSGKFAYAVDSRTEGALHSYRIDPDGSLHAIGGAIVQPGPRLSIAVDAQGHRLYVGDVSRLEIEVFDVDTATGALSERPAIPTGLSTSYATASKDGAILYAGQVNGIRAFATPTTGDVNEVTGSPFGTDVVQLAGAMVAHPGGKFIYSGGTVLNGFEIHTTGALQLLDGSPFSHHAADDQTAISVAMDEGGHHLYSVDTLTRTLSAFAIDSTSGALVPLLDLPYDASPAPYSVAIDPSGRFVWVGEDSPPNLVSVFSRDPTTGRLEKLPDVSLDLATGLQPEVVFAPYPAQQDPRD